MTVPRQIFCIPERGTYVKWDSPVGAKTCDSRRGSGGSDSSGVCWLIEYCTHNVVKTDCYCKQLKISQALQFWNDSMQEQPSLKRHNIANRLAAYLRIKYSILSCPSRAALEIGVHPNSSGLTLFRSSKILLSPKRLSLIEKDNEPLVLLLGTSPVADSA